MTIIISRSGRNARVIERSVIEKEEYLQEYIHENPGSIPIYEIKENRKLLVVAREYETVSGPIDALAIDADGDIYIVETKLYRNTDKRRVVAQALDYGASLWRHSRNFEILMERFDNEIEKRFHTSFQEKVTEFFDLDEDGVSDLIDGIRNNLNTGTLRFVIMMDTMDERLKDLILYINQNSNFDIYGVELDHYEFEEYEIMIPRMFGVEVKKVVASRTSSGRRKWDEESFFLQVEEKLRERNGDLHEFYLFCKKIADSISWGTGNTKGSFTPVMRNIHPKIFPLSFYSDGSVLEKISWYVEIAEPEEVNRIKEIICNELNESGLGKMSAHDVMKYSIYLGMEDFRERYESLKRIVMNFKGLKIGRQPDRTS